MDLAVKEHAPTERICANKCNLIFVSDEDQMNRSLLREILLIQGYDVQTFRSANEVVTDVLHNPDMRGHLGIFMGIRNPNPDDGIQATHMLRSMGYNNAIVAYSGSRIRSEAEYKDLSFCGFLHKPVMMPEVQGLLKRLF